MIESYLIAGGLGCGTKSNFKDEVLKAMQLHLQSKWYFRTPVKVSGHGLKTATLDMAFPFLALINDSPTNEEAVLTRLELVRHDYEDSLMYFLRKNRFIVPPDSANFSIIPFWHGEPGYRDEVENFNGIVIHILNAVLTVKYRNLELPTNVDAGLNALQIEQSDLEKKLDKQTIFNSSAEFDLLNAEQKEILYQDVRNMYRTTT